MSSEVIQLEDRNSGTSARILASLGFNLFEWLIPWAGGVHDVLWAEEGFATGEKRPSGSGIPLLFPFPGRLRGTSFEWEGQTYSLQAGDGRGNAIHGFIYNRPWRVIEQAVEFAVGRFHASQDAPELRELWPSDFQVEVRYTLRGTALECRMQMSNPGDVPLPCSLGLHPYFRMPLGKGTADDCLVRVPVSAEWPLEEMLPTGERHDLTDASRFAAGIPFPQMQFDNVFSGVKFGPDGTAQATIEDTKAGGRIRLEFDSLFSECVLYTPGHREAVCIEPYSSVPGSVQMDEPRDKGLTILGPGESLSTRWQIEVEQP